MNLADYLSELLTQRNEVSIPGLGHFERVRVNGYYNEQEAKFYPPGHQVKFSLHAEDDDIFAGYIAAKKSISLASAKYFTEKFIIKLKEDAAEGSFQFSGLGSFHTEGGRLVFKPNDKIENDASFYGYGPVNLTKPGRQIANEPETAIIVEHGLVEDDAIRGTETVEEQQIFEGEAEGKKLLNIWLVLLLILTIVILALLGTYRYNPVMFNRFNPFYQQPVSKKVVVVPVVPVVIPKDTVKKDTAAADTSIKKTTAAPQETKTADTLSQTGFAIRVDAFKGEKMANETVNLYKARGLDARIMPRTPRKLYKVIVGNYPTFKEAEIAKEELVKAKKIRKDSQVTSINNKK